MEKRCKKCGEVKPLAQFYRAAGMRDGHRNDCRSCNLADKAARHRANPEPARQRARKWAQNNPERVRAQMEKAKREGRKQSNNRRYHLKRKYGITPEDYDRMLAEQGGGCAICGAPPPAGGSLHVDHDHRTGKVRGLLCFTHNNALGDFGDDLDLLSKAWAYLDEHDPETQRMVALARARVAALVH